MRLAALPLAVAFAVLLVAALDRSLYRRWLQEDGWAEWATFFAFLLAGASGLRHGLRARGLARAWLLGLGAFCLFVAGEEISWGQRMLGFAPPDLFLEHNYQQESNVHNLLKQVLDTRWMVLGVAAGYGVILPLLARAWAWLPRFLAPAAGLAPGFALVALLEATYPISLVGELAELCLGLCFLADMGTRASAVDGAAAPRRTVWSAIVVLAGAAGMPSAVDAWTGLSSPETAARAMADLELLADDLRQHEVVQARLRSKRRVHKRIFTATRAGYLAFGERSDFLQGRPTPAEDPGRAARRDARGYFVDPWQQPLWVYYERTGAKSGRLLLYSFGPNRRRDTPVEGLAPAAGDADPPIAGDDLGVWLRVGWR